MEAFRNTIITGLLLIMAVPLASGAAEIAPAQAQALGKEAYLYGLPLVLHYREIYLESVWKESGDFKAPFNQLCNLARLATPEDKAIVAPNCDTPYSIAWLDLRAEPMVISTPSVEQGRYFSVQLVNLYAMNDGYLGTRTTGNSAGNFLIVGPGWKGDQPAGVSRVIPSETWIIRALFRTQLFGPGDLDNVKKIQAGYRVQTLSQFLGTAAATKAPVLRFPAWDEKKSQGLGFLEYLDLMLRLCPVHPSERALRARLAAIGVGGGTPIDLEKLSREAKEAIAAGMTEMRTAIQRRAESDVPFMDGALGLADFYGSREQLEAAARRWCLRDFYYLRSVGAIYGLDGHSVEEAIYSPYKLDSDDQPLDGAKHDYCLRLPTGKPLPARAFWSVTMYDAKTLLLVSNPINRYLINSAMLPDLKRDADGVFTLYVQRDSPGKDKESNWLPAPNGPFIVNIRLYLPEPEVQEHRWKQPPLERVK
jgi:hypothetical protein